MQAHWQKILGYLDCKPIGNNAQRQHCPLHPETSASLHITLHPITGAWHYRCEHAECRFSGDAVNLIQRVKDSSVRDVVNLFRIGEPLHSALDEKLGPAQLDEYLEDKDNQVSVARYLNNCEQEFHKTVRGRYAWGKLAQEGCLHSSPHRTPTGFGMLTQKEIPYPLREFSCKKYHKGNYLVYPYTYEGRIVRVKIQNIDEEAKPENVVRLLNAQAGIFMEENIDADSPVVYVAGSELTALGIYQRIAEGTAKTPPVICTDRLPLPHNYSNIRKIYLVALPDAPLTLEVALRFYAAQEAVTDNSECSASIQVLPILIPLSRTAATTYGDRYVRKRAQPLHTWLLCELDRLLTGNNVDLVYRAFESVTLTAKQKQELISHADFSGVGPQVVQFLEQAGIDYRRRFVLANEQEVRRSPDGFYALDRTKGNEHRLSNATFSVEERILTQDGNGVYGCVVRPADPQQPVIRIRLTDNDFSNGTSLTKAVNHAFLENNTQVYVSFYDKLGYGWRDIANKLSEGCSVRKEILHLGVDENFNIHLPTVTINSVDKRIEPQTHIFTAPEEVLSLYGGITYNPELLESRDPFRRLFEAADNSCVAGLIAGIMHVMHRMLIWRVHTTSRALSEPRHLFFVEGQAGIWLPIFRQLAMLFIGGACMPPQLPSAKTAQWLEQYSCLGALPYITLLPAGPLNKLQNWIADSPLSLISLVSTTTAANLAYDNRASFVVHSDYTKQEAEELDPSDIFELTQQFSGLLLEMATRPIDCAIANMLRIEEVPARALYRWTSMALGIEPKESVESMLQHKYIGSERGSIELFFKALYELMQGASDKHGIRTVKTSPTKKELKAVNPPHIHILPDVVILSKRLVEIVNDKWVGGFFTLDGLNQELKARGYLTESVEDEAIDTNRYWLLDRSVWRKYVERPQIELKPVAPSNVIQLDRLAS